MVDLPSRPLGEVDVEFEKVALETGGLTFGLTGTNVREKLLQVTAHDICLCNQGLAFKMHIMAAGPKGISYADLLALIRFVAPYAGYPAAASAFEALRRYGDELGLDTPTDAEPRTTAPDTDAVWAADDEWLRDFLDSRLSRAWSESRLSVRERAFVAITALVTLGELGEPFAQHLDIALCAADVHAVRGAVRFTAEMGVSKASAAVAALDEYLDRRVGHRTQ